MTMVPRLGAATQPDIDAPLGVTHYSVTTDTLQQAVSDLDIPLDELMWLLCASIEQIYICWGMLARACVRQDETGRYDVSVVIDRRGELIPEHVPIRPTPEQFRALIERHVAENAINKWYVARVTLETESLYGDYWMVGIDAEGMPCHDQEAVMPTSKMGRTGGKPVVGDILWAVVHPLRAERVPGAEPWTQTGAKWVASRTDSIFLRLLVKKYYDVHCRTEIVGDTGLVLLPPDADRKTYIGRNGATSNQMAELAGLRYIIWAHQIDPDLPIEKRIQKALWSICALRANIKPPAADGEPWTAEVPHAQLAKAVGPRGANAIFVYHAAGVFVRMVGIDRQTLLADQKDAPESPTFIGHLSEFKSA